MMDEHTSDLPADLVERCARALYIHRYAKDGGKWQAVETKDVWHDQAHAVLREAGVPEMAERCRNMQKRVADLEAYIANGEDERLTKAKHEIRQLKTGVAEMAKALAGLTTATGRLIFAAETSGGVAGRDADLCTELDRIAQPIGEARAVLSRYRSNGTADV